MTFGVKKPREEEPISGQQSQVLQEPVDGAPLQSQQPEGQATQLEHEQQLVSGSDKQNEMASKD